MPVLSLLNILASCAVKYCSFDGDGVSLSQMFGCCTLCLLVIGLAALVNRNTRQ
jgi:hypothetical protein